MEAKESGGSTAPMARSSPTKRIRQAWSASVVVALVTSVTVVDGASSWGSLSTPITTRQKQKPGRSIITGRAARFDSHSHDLSVLDSCATEAEPMACGRRRQHWLRLRGGSSGGAYNPDEWTTPQSTGRPTYQNEYQRNDDYQADARQRQASGSYGQDEDEEYDDYGRSTRRGTAGNARTNSGTASTSAAGLVSAMIPNIIKQGDRKIGLMLLASGISISFLGFALFMNKTLLRLGNLLIIAGVPMTLGPSRTVSYFVQPAKMRATSCLVLGILLVFLGHPILGILLEIFGLLNLFGNMFPIFMVFVKQMPVIGPLLKGNNNNSSSSNRGRSNRRDRNDDDYDDYGGRERPQQNFYDEYSNQEYQGNSRSNRPNY